MRSIRPILAAAALGFGGPLPAHATLIIEDYFEFAGQNVTCTSSASSTGSCGSGLPLHFRFDLRENIYDGGRAIAESHLSDQRALEYANFFQPLTASGSGQHGLLWVGFRESGPDTHLQQWSFSASGVDLDPGQSCSDCTLGLSVSRQLGPNAFYYLNFHSDIDDWFLNIREESFRTSGLHVTDRNYSGTTGQLTRVHTETFIPAVEVSTSVPEPSSFALLAIGLVALAFSRKRGLIA